MATFLRTTILFLFMAVNSALSGINLPSPPPLEVKTEILSGNETTVLNNGSNNHGTIIIGGIHIHK